MCWIMPKTGYQSIFIIGFALLLENKVHISEIEKSTMALLATYNFMIIKED